MQTFTGEQILDVQMGTNDAEAATIRDYLKQLLLTLWEKGERFSGKRPFGNSGWDMDIYAALVKAGVIEGDLDEDGFVNHCDAKNGDELIFSAIEALCKAYR